jgi:hypothetical protein
MIGSPGKHLGHGSDPEHVIFTHRLLGLDIRVSSDVFEMHLAGLIRNDRDVACEFVTVQVRLHGRGHLRACRRFAFGGNPANTGKQRRQQ